MSYPEQLAVKVDDPVYVPGGIRAGIVTVAEMLHVQDAMTHVSFSRGLLPVALQLQTSFSGWLIRILSLSPLLR